MRAFFHFSCTTSPLPLQYPQQSSLHLHRDQGNFLKNVNHLVISVYSEIKARLSATACTDSQGLKPAHLSSPILSFGLYVGRKATLIFKLIPTSEHLKSCCFCLATSSPKNFPWQSSFGSQPLKWLFLCLEHVSPESRWDQFLLAFEVSTQMSLPWRALTTVIQVALLFGHSQPCYIIFFFAFSTSSCFADLLYFL